MTRQTLEKYQVLVYLAAIGIGLAAGILLPGWTGFLESMLWPLLALLLYTTFTQVPLAHLRQAFTDPRFVVAAAIGNFLLIPLVVWGLMSLVPDEPAIRLGVLLVLLVPCTDWFITFTHLGGGDTKHAIAFSPVALLLQVILLPVYLWAFLGEDFIATVAQREMLTAFSGLIVLPLLAAFVTEKLIEKHDDRRQMRLLDRLAWFPVPLLAVVVLIIAATQVGLVASSIGSLGRLLPVFVIFLAAAGIIALILAQMFKLPPSQGRVLAFSLGTRNSFVVLPLALALPASFELAVVAIVFQSLVELLGMVAYLWWVPNKLFPMHPVNGNPG
ncbi:Arsenical-resistance protein Acr3 [Methylophilaceae bacterium]|nr:Arsenical-resistance protein Acr3 [Methylophilaceae bacterium]